jgi:multidrug efflux pump subunit AcrB
MWLAFGFYKCINLIGTVLAMDHVDDGIVVTENIFKKVEEVMTPIEAAIKDQMKYFFAVTPFP